ncbi:hypothetical protein LTR94_026799, partial [Friedmanniomyces endolithicus]
MALVVPPDAAYRYMLAHWAKEQPREMIFALDRFARPEQGTTLGDPGGRERIRLDNPFLSDQARTLLTQQLLATTVNANTGAALTAAQLDAQRAAINAGTFRFNLRRNWVDFGI